MPWYVVEYKHAAVGPDGKVLTGDAAFTKYGSFKVEAINLEEAKVHAKLKASRFKAGPLPVLGPGQKKHQVDPRPWINNPLKDWEILNVQIG